MRRKRAIAKGNLGRLGMLCLALVVALAGMGVGYAQIEGGLQNNGQVPTNCAFTWVVSNDDGEVTNISPYGDIDPGDDSGGTSYDRWDAQSSDDPSKAQEMGIPCARYDKDVARTTVQMSGDQRIITVLVENAYPCYYPTVFFGLKNTQSFSVKIKSIDISYDMPELTVTFDGITENQVLSTGEEVIGRLGIHTEQSAHQNSTYNVEVKVVLVQKE